MKTEFLCYSDYGQGGVMCYIWAESKEQIVRKYPEFKVLEDVDIPKWYTKEVEVNIRGKMKFDIDDDSAEFFKSIIRDRAKN